MLSIIIFHFCNHFTQIILQIHPRSFPRFTFYCSIYPHKYCRYNYCNSYCVQEKHNIAVQRNRKLQKSCHKYNENYKIYKPSPICRPCTAFHYLAISIQNYVYLSRNRSYKHTVYTKFQYTYAQQHKY